MQFMNQRLKMRPCGFNSSNSYNNFLDYATKIFSFFDGCARQVLYKTVVLVLANRDQMRYNESKWGTQMDGLRVDVIVLT